ncbi:MAG: hypothetical protein ACKO96_12780 [Flammeovirgaceae bacterium]
MIQRTRNIPKIAQAPITDNQGRVIAHQKTYVNFGRISLAEYFFQSDGSCWRSLGKVANVNTR